VSVNQLDVELWTVVCCLPHLTAVDSKQRALGASDASDPPSLRLRSKQALFEHSVDAQQCKQTCRDPLRGGGRVPQEQSGFENPPLPH